LDEIWIAVSALSAAGSGRFLRAICTVVKAGQPGEILFFFCQVNETHDFIHFLSAKFHKIRTQHVDGYGDENVQNRILKILP